MQRRRAEDRLWLYDDLVEGLSDLGNRCPRQYHDLHPERLWRGHLHQAPRLCQLQGLDVADGGAGLFADARRRRDVDDWPRRQYHDQRSRQSCSVRWRSEEHTSELQSLMRKSYAVFCLKTKTTNT